MHELNVTRNLLRVALEQAQVQQGERIQRLHITLDPNSGYSPESIRFYFEELARNSPAAHAALAFTWSKSGPPIRLAQVDIAEFEAAGSDAETLDTSETSNTDDLVSFNANSSLAHWQLDFSNAVLDAAYVEFIDQLLTELDLQGNLQLAAPATRLEIYGPHSQLAHFCHHLRHDAPVDQEISFRVAELSS